MTGLSQCQQCCPALVIFSLLCLFIFSIRGENEVANNFRHTELRLLLLLSQETVDYFRNPYPSIDR